MKFLLIAIYLGHGQTTPTMHHQQFSDIEVCRARAKLFTERAQVGHARAFCVKLREGILSDYK